MPIKVVRLAKLPGAIGLLALAYWACGWPHPASAIPVFAHRYGFSCQTCHTAIPHLTGFGDRFRANGYQLPGLSGRGVWPVATKVNLAYSSAPDFSGSPKAVVDEIELLSGGSVGSKTSYFAELYAVDGGRPGAVREAWAAYQTGSGSRPWASPRIRVGQFTLPLPLDPETFRETSQHYAIWDRSVGNNAFNFFDPHQGLSLELGDGSRTNIGLLALAGHDKQSGIRAYGMDRMLYAQQNTTPVVLSAYRYDGTRPLGPTLDRFWRQGYGFGLRLSQLDLDAVYQHGFDTSADGSGVGTRSSGGFLQARYAVSQRDFLIARYDGTQDTNGFYRAAVLGVGHRMTRNSRLTLEDVITHGPATSHTLNAALLFAY